MKRKIARTAMSDCMLCSDAKCSSACVEFDPARVLRSLWFDNENGARAIIPDTDPCKDCEALCEMACPQQKLVPIRNLMMRIHDEIEPKRYLDRSRLQTNFLGFSMENPFLLSSSVVGSNYDMCKRAFDQGWAGVAFKTICLFDIHETSPRFASVKDANGNIIGFKNIEQLSDHTLEENMETFRRLKKEYPNKYLLASIMGSNEEEWEYLARVVTENGADAVELNFSCPNMQNEGLGSDVGQDNLLIERFTRAAKRGTSKPVIAKLTPNVAEMSSAGEAAMRGGADALAAINTIKSYITLASDEDIRENKVRKTAIGGYSGASVKPIALRFVAELKKNPKLTHLPISGMGGVETWRDAVQFMILGASTIQITTAVMLYGYRIIDDLCDGLLRALDYYGLECADDLVGVGLQDVVELQDVERDIVIYPKFDLARCAGCKRCELSCMDGGHQAIQFVDGKPHLNAKKCVGCHLCIIVCPKDAITSSNKVIHVHKSTH